MKIKSIYENMESMPSKYANIGVSGGENISPPFWWEEATENTKSFAILMVDHHPVANEFVHWIVININKEANSIDEGASGSKSLPRGAIELNTSYGIDTYGGPRPPAGTGDHPYETIIYALNVESLGLEKDTTLDKFEAALEGKVIEKASITGTFAQ